MNFTVDVGIRASHLPLFVCFAAFVVTFVVTRLITRMIRAGVGPFRDNVSESGLHVHHAVPGIILLIVGAFMAIGTDSEDWTIVAAVLVGIGTSLVLDEFALILHLQDVYWADEGRISVEMVSLAIACLGLVLIGFSPFGLATADVGTGTAGVIFSIGFLILWVVICVDKGKYRTALLACFLPVVGVVGAVRLARPGSRWAKKRYGPEKLAKAEARTARFDRRWGPYTNWLSDFVAGMPPEAAGQGKRAPAGDPEPT
ncbi:MAG: hypothetical protein U0W40_06205 [Acidimicrobiia bacterium]